MSLLKLYSSDTSSKGLLCSVLIKTSQKRNRRARGSASGIKPCPLAMQHPLLFEYFSEMDKLCIREFAVRVLKGQ